ncbi:MAG: response regulator transcription factor [[Clostridium] innocuum]
MSEERILIVEDDETINSMIREFLQKDYTCLDAYSGTEARLVLQQTNVSLVLLDLMLPGISGEALLKELKLKQLPVIVLSAKDAIDDRVALLNEGADDYLCKPFDLKELKARIQVQLRKRMPQQEHEIAVDGVVLLPDFYHLEIQGKKIRLTRHEYRILELLMRDVKRARTKKEIYEYAWEDDYLGDDKTINVHISNIRSKLNAVSKREYIETIWGIGFKWKD